MKGIFITILLLLSVNLIYANSTEADKLIGTYFTYKNKSKVTIYQDNGKYFGKVVWLENPNQKDTKNPNVDEQTKPLMNKIVLKDFVYKGKNTWSEGTVYDPHSGHTFSCKITLLPNGNINVRGYIGFSFLGKTMEWVRTN